MITRAGCTVDRPFRLRVAQLVVTAVLLGVLGASSGHAHAPGSFDAARACSVCHGGEQPLGVLASLDPLVGPGLEFSDLVLRPESAPALFRATGPRSRAPPTV